MKSKLTVLSLIAIAGCTTTLEDNIKVYNQDKNRIEKLRKNASYNQELIWDLKNCKDSSKCPFTDEANYLESKESVKGYKKHELTALSLSGGGTRSASFSIGVLKALHDAKKLDQIDIISGVSGGAYATYWYFSQNYWMDDVNKYLSTPYNQGDIFRTKDEYLLKNNPLLSSLEPANNYRFQTALEESSDILSYRHDDSITTPIFNGIKLPVQLFIQGLSTPAHWITNGLFDWEINGMPFFYYYKDGLDRTYGYVPLDYTMEHFANAQPDKFFFGLKNMDAFSVFTKDFDVFFSKKRDCENAPPSCKPTPTLPYFIINTTGVLDAKLNSSVFNKDGAKASTENRVFEFTPWGCHSVLLGINKQSNKCEDFHWRSGAYKDLDLAKIVAISGAAVDGKTQPIDADGNADNSNFWLNLFMDVAHLNMGYHMDNPNNSTLNSLFHKFLPWPLYLLHDWASNENSTSGIYLSDGGHSENLAVWPLIRRGVREIYLVDAEQDQLSKFDSAKRLNKELEKYGYQLCLDQDHPLSVNNSEKPIFHASIKKGACANANSTIQANIHYVKLSSPSFIAELKGQANVKLPHSVLNYMKEHPRFPHESTADIFYSPEQFVAYRDLGYKLMLCHLDSRTCNQPEHYSNEINPDDYFKNSDKSTK